ncbi:hypothetical protein THAOC_37450, partial [Thalassiosira oceanica]
KRNGNLPQVWKERLELLGVDWEEAKNLKWRQRFEELKQYNAKHGTCEVRVRAASQKKAKALRQWVYLQRIANNSGKLTDVSSVPTRQSASLYHKPCLATMAKCSKKGGKQPADKHAPRSWLEIPALNEEDVGAITTRSRGKKKNAFKKKPPRSLKPRHSQPPFGANARHVNRGRGELKPRKTLTGKKVILQLTTLPLSSKQKPRWEDASQSTSLAANSERNATEIPHRSNQPLRIIRERRLNTRYLEMRCM